MLLVAAALLLTYSRAAYVGLVLQMLLLGGVAWLRVQRSADRQGWQVLLVALFAVGVLALIAPHAVRRLLSVVLVSDASASNRLALYAGSAEFFLLRPFSGWGAGAFPSLYSAFFRIPGISYPYADAHSALFLTLIERGAAGLMLAVLAITGLCLKQTLLRTPPWVLAALIGIFPCYVLDNPAFQLHGPAMLGLLTLAPLCAIASQQERRYGVPRWAKWTPAALMALWCLGAMQPLPAARELVEIRTARSLNRLIGQTGLVMRGASDTVNMQIGHTGDAPSVLAGLAVLTDAALNRGHRPVGVPHEVTKAVCRAPGDWTITFKDAAVLLLAQPAPEAARWLEEAIPPGELQASCQRLFGHDGFALATIDKPCPQCGGLDLAPAGPHRQEGLQRYATTASLSQVFDAYLALTDPATTQGAALSEAIRGGGDRLGLTRHLVTEIPWDSVSFYTGQVREEIVLFRDGSNTWGIAAASRAPMDIAPRADTAINRMFGMAGWRIFTAFEALPSMWDE
jgi:hypothetical protein